MVWDLDLYLWVDIPETTTQSFLCFLLGRLGHEGLLVPIISEVVIYDTSLLVAVAMQWRLRWWGTPCAPPPQKGGGQCCHQMNQAGLSGPLSGDVDQDQRRFPNKSYPSRSRRCEEKDIYVCSILWY